MNKKFLSLILCIFLLYSQPSSAGLGASINKFCDQFGRIQAIARLFSPYVWWSIQYLPTPAGPVPVPGVVKELAQDTSPIVAFCNYVNQLQQLDTAGQVFLTGEVLNQMTNDRWRHHTDFAADTWSLAQNAYDFENGELRKGAFESEAFHQEMNSYMNDSYYWYNKTFNGQEKNLKDRAQREQDMRELANTSYERATLAEALDCPEPQGDVKYGEVYDTQVRPKEEQARELKEEVDFYFSQMLQMGPYFMNNEKDHQKYVFQLEALRYTHITIISSTKKRKETSSVPSQRFKDKDGNAEMKNKTVDRNYNEFSVKVNTQAFNNFRLQYEEKWQTYVTNRVIQKGFDDLLDDPRQHIQEEFIDLDYECAQFKLMNGIDPNRGDYDQIFLQRRRQCEQRIIMNEQKIENLLTYYLNRLRVTLFSYNSKVAESMTLQSRVLGRTLVMTESSGKNGGIRQQKITCAEGNTFDPATLVKLNSKIKSNNAKIRQQIAADRRKLLVNKENERKEKVEVAREAIIREEFAERRNKKLQEGSSSSAITSPMGQSTNEK